MSLESLREVLERTSLTYLEIAKRFAGLIRQEGFSGRIIVYGSVARKEAGRDSDIDVCLATKGIKSPPLSQELRDRLQGEGVVFGEGPGQIHLRVERLKNLKPNHLPRVSSILRDGIDI